MQRYTEIKAELDRERWQYTYRQLRRGHWEPISRAKAMSRTKRAINPLSGRLAWFHKCSTTHGHGCGQEFIAASVQVDHVQPVIATTGRGSIQELVERFCVPVDGLQILCKACHSRKSVAENARRVK